MKVEKTNSTVIQMRQDSAAAQKAKADQAQQAQQKQAQAAQEAKKVQEEKKGAALKGGEINITA
jgi:hypothetical protein